MSEVFAHQGGWDEALFVAIPMVLVALLLWVANRRASQAEPRADREANDDSDSSSPRKGLH